MSHGKAEVLTHLPLRHTWGAGPTQPPWTRTSPRQGSALYFLRGSRNDLTAGAENDLEPELENHRNLEGESQDSSKATQANPAWRAAPGRVTGRDPRALGPRPPKPRPPRSGPGFVDVLPSAFSVFCWFSASHADCFSWSGKEQSVVL